MPIRGRSLGAVSRSFIDHLNRTLALTVTQKPLTLAITRDNADIRFRDALTPDVARIQTRFGRMALYVGQFCTSDVSDDGEHLLKTLQYQYALLPEGHTEAQIRWEYVRVPGDDAVYCRHHLQGPPSRSTFKVQSHLTLTIETAR